MLGEKGTAGFDVCFPARLYSSVREGEELRTCKRSLEIVITARGARGLPVPLVHLNDIPAWSAASEIADEAGVAAEMVPAVPGGVF